MIYDVYVLGGGFGNFDPVDALRAGPKRGELTIKRRFHNSPNRTLFAELVSSDRTQLLVPLENVQIIGMDHKGMVIEGIETFKERETKKGRESRFTQRWLCKLPGVPAVLDTEKLLKRSAVRLRARRATGFDPSDDDGKE